MAVGVRGEGSKRAAAARSPQHLVGPLGSCSEPARGLCGAATALRTPRGGCGDGSEEGQHPWVPAAWQGLPPSWDPPPRVALVGPFCISLLSNCSHKLVPTQSPSPPRLAAPFSDPRGSPVRFPCLERIPCSAGTPARPPPAPL